MRLPPHPSGSPVEPTLALINVVFLLLLFFVVTGTIVYQHDRSILPPTSFLLVPGKAPVDAIYVDANGRLSFRGTVQGPAAIAQALRAGIGPEAGSEGLGRPVVARPVQVVADHRLRAQTLLVVIRELKDQGLQSLSIVTVRDDRR
jgi:biopolymer transport protein ExbD